MRIFAPKRLQSGYQMFGVVVGTRHQMSAAHVEPFNLREKMSESLFDNRQSPLQIERRRLAQCMKMQPFDAFGQGSQLVGRYAQARSRRTRIVQIGFDIGKFRIDAQTARDTFRCRQSSIFGILSQRVESDMTTAQCYLFELGRRVNRRISVRLGAEFFVSHTRFAQRTRRRTPNIFAKNWKCTPQRKRLERQNNFDAGTFGHRFYQCQIATQERLFEHIARRRYARIIVLFKFIHHFLQGK